MAELLVREFIALPFFYYQAALFLSAHFGVKQFCINQLNSLLNKQLLYSFT